jgi:hypothetical protein
MKNTLAYCGFEIVTDVKGFMIQTAKANVIKLFSDIEQHNKLECLLSANL